MMTSVGAVIRISESAYKYLFQGRCSGTSPFFLFLDCAMETTSQNLAFVTFNRMLSRYWERGKDKAVLWELVWRGLRNTVKVAFSEKEARERKERL